MVTQSASEKWGCYSSPLCSAKEDPTSVTQKDKAKGGCICSETETGTGALIKCEKNQYCIGHICCGNCLQNLKAPTTCRCGPTKWCKKDEYCWNDFSCHSTPK